ncbi:uncharacterized protein [Parasteatoda tepidariorum]|uniref:uncharacterized protein n=1 Tax=Parasteatoda tepidariorum TaxID=114398 RepID=UPI001C720F48|nr:uncharacterized protein LOC107457450 [Parasteatoda tepidariorum]
MGRDNRRVAPPDNCMSPNFFKSSKKQESIVNEKGERRDGRKPDDIRPMSLKVGLIPTVTGSAYLECGNTKVICSVIGPRDVLTKSDSATKGQLSCEFKYNMFSCRERQPYVPSDEEMATAKAIQDALEPVILLHKFPKSRLDITIYVLQDDGGAAGAAITCAGAALSNAGVEMYDLPVGCTLIYCNSQFLIDPTAEEENYSEVKDFTKISMAMMVEYQSQVIYMDSSGYVNPSLLTESLKMLQSSCHQVVTAVKLCLKKHVKEMNEELQDELNKGSVDRKGILQAKLLQPQTYLKTFLENNIREDSRNLPEFRAVLIDVGTIDTANGSALVRLGSTAVLCGIKAELTNPLPAHPDKGFFVPNVTLTPICSNRFVPGPPTEQAQVYSQMIMDLWKNSLFIDPAKLCIVPKNLAWCVFADIMCLSYDGNIFDACVLALMSALRNTKLPEVSVNDETSKIEVTDNFVDLNVDSFVSSATFAVFNESVVADPSLEEESLSNSSVTVILNPNLEMSIHSDGPITEKVLDHCIDSAKERYSEMKELIENLS